jgi:hypothetical protein
MSKPVVHAPTTKAILNILESAMEADPIAIKKLLQTRVKCNEQLKEHPSVIVGDDDEGNTCISFVGLINGALHSLNEPLIATCSIDNTIVGFQTFK